MSASLFLLAVSALVVLFGAMSLAGLVIERRRHEEAERENARLLAEATVREEERVALADRLIRAEQDERRRLALFLHDGPVQSLSGIALMLDGAMHALGDSRAEQAREIVGRAVDKQRDTIRSLRDLSFNIEPVVLRDQGFGPAVRELALQLGTEHALQIEVDVERGERLEESVQAGLYQIIRELLNQAVRRGPPTRISVTVREQAGGAVETVVADDGKGERRKATLDAIAERATTLNARFSVEQGLDGGTAIHVVLPAYASGTGPAPRD